MATVINEVKGQLSNLRNIRRPVTLLRNADPALTLVFEIRLYRGGPLYHEPHNLKF